MPFALLAVLFVASIHVASPCPRVVYSVSVCCVSDVLARHLLLAVPDLCHRCQASPAGRRRKKAENVAVARAEAVRCLWFMSARGGFINNRS